ncbi:MAG: metalloregulator ArsR/SmtB family transcription factor, partial [Pseudohongiellaceae bacterium]
MPKQDAVQKNKILKHPAPPVLEDSESLALLCKAAGDNLRLTILRILRTESLGVLEMSKILGIRQSALSHHLKVLAGAGLVSTRREINTKFYRRVILGTDDPLAAL